MSQPVHLKHRAIVAVTGGDAREFLGGLITNSLSAAQAGNVRYAALLTPQGKVIADFLVFETDGGFLFDCAGSVAADLVRKLSMFKLRSQVAVSARDDLAAIAFAGAADPRNPDAPLRSVAPIDAAPALTSTEDYHARRIACSLAEQGFDFETGDVFPADINMDAQSGVDFSKGCFVGQEVVSRMKRRGTARRRTLAFRFDAAAAPSPGPVVADDFEIGAITSVSGAMGLGRVRIDRLAEAEDAGHALRVNDHECRAIWPDWLAPPPGSPVD